MSQQIDLYGYQPLGGQVLSGLPNCYLQQIPVSRPAAFELVIEKTGEHVSLDYGSEIRLLMAEPVKGMKLREAIQLLKEALCKPDPHQ